MRSVDERARHRADHLKRHDTRDRQWRRVRADLCRSTIAPRLWGSTRWNESLPISMPGYGDRGGSSSQCSLSLVPLASFACWRGREHGRTIPFTGPEDLAYVRCRARRRSPQTVKLCRRAIRTWS